MVKEKDIKQELLKQMNKDSDKIPNTTDSIREIFAKDAARVKRMKWLTVFIWLFLLIFLIIAGIIEYTTKSSTSGSSPQNTVWISVMAVGLQALIFLAIFFTVSFYTRSEILSIKQIK